MENQKKTTVLGHLEEVRVRLTKSLIAVAVCIIICFPLARYVFPILTDPVPGIDLYQNTLTGLVGIYMKISLYGGVVLSMPYLLYHFVMFLNPALTSREKKYLYTLMPSTILLFIVGVSFCYFVLLPPALNFLYNTFPNFVGSNIQPWLDVGDYISVVTRLLFWMGVCFEIPMVMYFLSKIGVLSPEWVRRKWKYAVVFAFILGAIITPTFDPINQSLVAGPIMLLYGLGYLLAKIARMGTSRKRRETI
jgi:sec-independent protein translocase protein TatC